MARAPLPVQSVRMARPAADLERSRRFYVDELGLEHLGGFDDHHDYDGIFLGIAGASWHVELTRHVSGHPAPSPTDEDLLVLYLDAATVRATADHLVVLGHPQVPHPNPYWEGVGAAAFTDPDGYLVMLCPVDG